MTTSLEATSSNAVPALQQEWELWGASDLLSSEDLAVNQFRTVIRGQEQIFSEKAEHESKTFEAILRGNHA
eukprot:290724-Amphidinium_carterae.5